MDGNTINKKEIGQRGRGDCYMSLKETKTRMEHEQGGLLFYNHNIIINYKETWHLFQLIVFQ